MAECPCRKLATSVCGLDSALENRYIIAGTDVSVLFPKPNEFTKAVQETQELSGAQRIYMEFWTAFREYMKSEGSTVRLPKPGPYGWLTVSIGKTGFAVNPTLSVQKGYVGCELYIGGAAANQAFARLQAQKEEIEAELGSLDWQPLPERNDFRIAVYEEGHVDLMRRDEWANHFKWLKERCEEFAKVFGPRVKALTLL